MQIQPYSPASDFLGVIRPSAGRHTLEHLLHWLEASREQLDTALTRHGALLFRGFDVPNAESFERVALRISPDLKRQYLGNSPRNARSTYTFTASELPAHYPIMQHCEMSFLPSAPARLFFCCTGAPGSPGGETPLADCRAVLEQLDPDVRERFLSRQLRIVRNYAPPGKGTGLDPWQLKSWPEIFSTEDRQAVEALAAKEGTRCEWRADGGLRLIREQPFVQPHPVTGDQIWFNHLQVFHSEAARFEYRQILARQPSLQAFGVWGLLEALTAGKRWFKRPEDIATQCFYDDGTPIAIDDVKHVIEVFWQNMAFPRWQNGDFTVIDNFRTSHGRMPYRGPREVLVAFTEGRPVTPPGTSRENSQAALPLPA